MREPVRCRAAALILSIFPLLLAACGGGYGRPDAPGSQIAFGVDMARRGLWSEALFRFHQAERLDPNNPRVYNNLAVAYEATGEFDKALDYYQRALRASPENRELRANYARFVEFYQGFKPAETKPGAAQPAAGGTGTPAAPDPAGMPPTPPAPPAAPTDSPAEAPAPPPPVEGSPAEPPAPPGEEQPEPPPPPL